MTKPGAPRRPGVGHRHLKGDVTDAHDGTIAHGIDSRAAAAVLQNARAGLICLGIRSATCTAFSALTGRIENSA
jgi:hypothetical protein